MQTKYQPVIVKMIIFFRVDSWSGITAAKDMRSMEVVHIFARAFLEVLCKFIFPRMEKVSLTTFWPAVNIVFKKKKKKSCLLVC